MAETIFLLDRLRSLFPDCSASTLRSWLKEGRISVDGAPVKLARAPVTLQQTVELQKRRRMAEGGLEVLYEDNHLVVVHKPVGLLSVATDFQNENTAHTHLKERYRPGRVFVVHRLDRDTSGLMLFARSEEAYQILKEKFAAHEIQRQYEAVVKGRMEENEGRWQCYLRDGGDCVVRPSSPETGKLAISHYQVVGKSMRHTRIYLQLETGRKNQIRVHCQQAGHPIVGDRKYGSTEDPVRRLCLHAAKLLFSHPVSGKPMMFTAPVPEEFDRLVPRLHAC